MSLCAVAASLLSGHEYNARTRKVIGTRAFPEITRIPTSWVVELAKNQDISDFSSVKRLLLKEITDMGFRTTPSPFTPEALTQAQRTFTKERRQSPAAKAPQKSVNRTQKWRSGPSAAAASKATDDMSQKRAKSPQETKSKSPTFA